MFLYLDSTNLLLTFFTAIKQSVSLTLTKLFGALIHDTGFDKRKRVLKTLKQN